MKECGNYVKLRNLVDGNDDDNDDNVFTLG